MKTPRLILRLLCLSSVCLSSLTCQAADIPISGTNALQGVVRFTNADAEILSILGDPGDEGMDGFTLYAYTDPPEVLISSKGFAPTGRLSEPYSMTVAANDVPLIYQAYAYISMDHQVEEYWTSPRYATSVTSNSPPAMLDIEECVGLIELRYEDSLGQPVAAAGGRGLAVETGPPYGWRARYLAQPAGRTANFFTVPSGVELEVTVEVDLGTDIYTDRYTHLEKHVLTLGCDEKRVLVLQVPDGGTVGRIAGNVNLVGEVEVPTDGYQELLGRPVIKAVGPSGNQRYTSLVAEHPDPDSARAFALENLVPSTPEKAWNVYAELHFGLGRRFQYFRTPGLGEGTINPGVTVAAAETTDLADTFVMNPAKVTGTITLSGPPEFLGGNRSALRSLVRASDYDENQDDIPDGVGAVTMHGSYVVVSGVDEPAAGASLTAAGGLNVASFAGEFNPATSSFEGDYEAAVAMPRDEPGVWKLDGLNVQLYDPGTEGSPLVSQGIWIQESAPWQGTLLPGERVTQDLNYSMAEVCLRIRSPGLFFYPRIINSSGGLTNIDSRGVPREYAVMVQNASAPPYTAENATNEAVVTFYLPEGSYTLNPAYSSLDAAGGISEVQLPAFQLSVVGGERVCIEECIQLTITPPVCTGSFGFLARAEALSCDGSLTNLSLRASPLSDPGIRLGYSDIRILIGSRTDLTTAHGLFPEFDGFNNPELYRDILYTAIAMDNKGRVATRQFVAHYDLLPPVLQCPADIVRDSPDGEAVVVEFEVTGQDDRPEPTSLICDPPSGSLFPIGTTLVTCQVTDLCRNTNTCTFNVIVNPPVGEGCPLRIELSSPGANDAVVSWDCPGVLEEAPSVDGPWSEVPGAVSPYSATAGSNAQFFRLGQTATEVLRE